MPPTFAEKKPAAPHPHARRSRKPTPAELEAQRREHLAFVRKEVGNNHSRWITARRSATLGDLLAHLEGVQDELMSFNDDDILADIADELGDAADYLSDFAPLDEPVGLDGELATVEYRLANVEEDIGFVEELIEAVGRSYKVSRLPKRNRRDAA